MSQDLVLSASTPSSSSMNDDNDDDNDGKTIGEDCNYSMLEDSSTTLELVVGGRDTEDDVDNVFAVGARTATTNVTSISVLFLRSAKIERTLQRIVAGSSNRLQQLRLVSSATVGNAHANGEDNMSLNLLATTIEGLPHLKSLELDWMNLGWPTSGTNNDGDSAVPPDHETTVNSSMNRWQTALANHPSLQRVSMDHIAFAQLANRAQAWRQPDQLVRAGCVGVVEEEEASLSQSRKATNRSLNLSFLHRPYPGRAVVTLPTMTELWSTQHYQHLSLQHVALWCGDEIIDHHNNNNNDNTAADTNAEEGMQQVHQALAHNPTVRRISLRHCVLCGPAPADPFVPAPRPPPVRKYSMLSGLATNQALQTLDLRDSVLSRDEGLALVQALRQNRSLQALDVSRARLGTATAPEHRQRVLSLVQALLLGGGRKHKSSSKGKIDRCPSLRVLCMNHMPGFGHEDDDDEHVGTTSASARARRRVLEVILSSLLGDTANRTLEKLSMSHSAATARLVLEATASYDDTDDDEDPLARLRSPRPPYYLRSKTSRSSSVLQDNDDDDNADLYMFLQHQLYLNAIQFWTPKDPTIPSTTPVDCWAACVAAQGNPSSLYTVLRLHPTFMYDAPLKCSN